MQSIGEEQFFACMAEAFRYAVVCTKHPGFMEEREWRVIYSPAIRKSAVIVEDIETIGGVPQKVCKLPLKDQLELGLEGFDLSKLIDRVIVGPCQNPFEIYEALVELMSSAGVADANSKVFVSDIPLRQQR